MQNLPIFPTDWKRDVSKSAELPLLNRFLERNPSLDDSEYSVISRPALSYFTTVGTGHIRKIYNEPGVFGGDAFVVSGTNLYKVNSTTGASTDLGVISTNAIGDVSMAATAPIGTSVPAYLFIAEGQVLWFYTDNGYARAQLEITGSPLVQNIANNDEIEVNGTHYRWTTGSVDAGTPDGTSSNPYLVARGTNDAESLTNVFNALNANGLAGTDYSTAISVANSTVLGLSYSATDLFVQAVEAGSGGNTFSSTVVTGADIAFTASTFAGGGTDQLSQISLPDDVGAISVAAINSFIIVIPVQREDLGTVGRFYWIEPGEIVIDPLNFATAERSPDRINQVITFSDMFWLFGDRTTEPWVTTGSPDAPMQRFQGIIFDRGSWEGTAVKIRDSMMVVDEEGAVFVINNGQKRVSNPSIEERIRRSIQIQALREG